MFILVQKRSFRLSLEQLFLVECVRRIGNEKRFPPICTEDALDWNWILEAANVHRLTGFLPSAIHESVWLRCPSNIRAFFSLSQDISLAKTRMKQKKFLAFWDAFKKYNIPLIPIKGLAFSYQLYRNEPFRSFSDVDVLVPSEKKSEAISVLFDLGFSSFSPMSRFSWHREIVNASVRKNYSWDQNFDREGRHPFCSRSFVVDLHWRLNYRWLWERAELDCDKIWKLASPSSYLPEGVYKTSETDSFAITLLHAACSCNDMNLIHFVDLLRILRKDEAMLDGAIEHSFRSYGRIIKARLKNFQILLKDLSNSNRPVREFSHSSQWLLKQYFKRRGVFKNIPIEGTIKKTKQLRQLSQRQRLLYALGFFIPNVSFYTRGVFKSY